MDELTLYHGSRGGIVGDIQPSSRERCDFGKGFYMGTNANQAKTLVANDQAPYFYTVSLNQSALLKENILYLNDLDWAYFVLYNRGKLHVANDTVFFKKYSHLGDGKDLIIGPIADDVMNESMNRFIHNQITDKAFLESIRALDYGVQYVAKTSTACACIKILSEKELYGQELDYALRLASRKRSEGRKVADNMQKKYRREGKYLDEILSEVCMEKNLYER